MIIGKRMNHNVKLLDRALECLEEPILTKNIFFETDPNYVGDDFTRVYSVVEESISLVIDFSLAGIDVHLQESSEVYSWGCDFIETNPNKVVRTLVMLITSKVEVESCSDKIKKFIFRDALSDKIVDVTKVIDSVFVNPFKKSTHYYPEIISKKCSRPH